MNKPEYSDLYKFIVSLGLILIAFAILLPWLFLRESFDSLIPASDITNLTPIAQTLIAYRQNTGLWFIQNIIWLSAPPAIFGFLSLLAGLFLWQKKQRVLDRRDELETQKLNLEVQNMSPEQIAVELVQESVNSNQDKQDEKLVIKEQLSIIGEYVRIENIVFDRLSDCFGSSNVVRHQQVKDSGIDMLVRINSSERAIFEIKYYKKIYIAQKTKKDIQSHLLRSIRAYKSFATHSTTHGIGLVILGVDSLIDGININEEIIDNISIKIIAISENRFIALSRDELKSIITNSSDNQNRA